MTTVSSPVQIGAKTNANAIGKIVTTSSGTTAILDGIGRVYTLGSGGSGTLGDGTTVAKSTPTLVTLGSFGRTASVIEAGYTNFGAVSSNNQTLYTWGDNSAYQLGDGTTIGKSSPVAISITKTTEYPWKSITQGATHFAAIRTTDGALFSWGGNAGGQLGDGTTIGKSAPTKIGNNSWSIVAAGASHTVAIDTTGALYTWGDNGNAALGDGTIISKSSPVKIGTSSWSSVSAGLSHTTGTTTNGGLWAWGLNNVGQVGYFNGFTGYATPTQIGFIGGYYSFKQVAASVDGFFSAGITTEGALYTWGLGTTGQLGDNTSVSKSSPVKIGTSSWSVVSVGATHMAAIDSTGALYAWGLGTSGQLGDNTAVSKSSPVQIGTSSWSSVSAGALHTTATDINGNLFTWGSNATGQIGDGTITSRSSPVLIPIISAPTWKQLSINEDGTLSAGITTTGALYTWGLGTSGQLGDNTIVSKSSPVKIGSSSWSVVSTGFSHIAAIDSTGALYAWGLNTSGQLGNNSTTSTSSPVKIGTRSWTSVSAGGSHTTATDINGNLYSWGSNATGQVGNYLNSASYSSPVQIQTAALGSFVWQQLVTNNSSYASAGITTTGALYTWGAGTQGNLGNNNINDKSTPVKIGSSSWTIVSPGLSNMSAIDINGRLYVWGYNGYGNLGDGTTVAKSSPIQIGTSSWSAVATGQFATLAIDINGRLFAWGSNVYTQLGDGTTISRSSPVQLGTNSWSKVSAGGSHIAAIDSTGALYTWGYFAGISNTSSPVKIGASSWSVVAAGGAHNVGLDITGRLFAWGDNQFL